MRPLLICLLFVGCISFEPTQQAEPTGSQLSVCGAAETLCDGRDDDCDGEIDEGITRDCSTCLGAGEEICVGGNFTGCTAPALTTESCNGIDDDCNNEVDDDVTRACTSCVGIGIETCMVGAFMGCTSPPGPPETCNNFDDDCDGEIDEGVTQPCANCKGSGVQVCTAGAFGSCSAPALFAELCNGLDDDCDSQIDNGYQVGAACDGADPDACANGVWQCDGSGGRVCTDAEPPIFDFCAACNAGSFPTTYRVGQAQGSTATPAAAWNSVRNEWGIVWGPDQGSGEVWFSRLNAQGVPIAGSEVQLSQETGAPEPNEKAADIAWSGNHYAVVWMSEDGTAANSNILMRGVGPTGALLQVNPIDVTDEGATARKCWFPKIVWAPTPLKWIVFFECAASTGDPDDIYTRASNESMSNFDPALGSLALAVVTGTGAQREISLALSPTRLGLSYRDFNDNHVRGCSLTIDALGNPSNCTSQNLSVNLAGTAQAPSMIFNGTDFRTFFHDDRSVPAPTGNTIRSNLLSTGNVPGGVGQPAVLPDTVTFAAAAYDPVSASTFMACERDVDTTIARVAANGTLMSSVQLTNTATADWRPNLRYGASGVALVSWRHSYTGGSFVKAITCTP